MEFGLLTATRVGKKKKDFLAERLFLQDASSHPVMLFSDVPELDDKSAWAGFAASRSLFNLPVEYGHDDICLNYHCYDGVVYKAMIRKQRQLAAAVALKAGAGLSDGLAFLKSLLTWTDGNCCLCK